MIAAWNTLIWGYGRDDDRFVPYKELGRLRVCKDIDEKATVLKEWFEGKEFKHVGAYKGMHGLGYGIAKKARSTAKCRISGAIEL